MSFFRDPLFDDIHSSFFDKPMFNFQYPYFYDPYFNNYDIDNQMANTLENISINPFSKGFVTDSSSPEDEDILDEIMGSDNEKNDNENEASSDNDKKKKSMINNRNNGKNNSLNPYYNKVHPFRNWMGNFNYNQSKIIKPRMDITEEKDHYLIHTDLPGLTKNDVQIELSDGGILSISGERKWNYQKSSPLSHNQYQLNNPDNADSNNKNFEQNSSSNDYYNNNNSSNHYTRIERRYGHFKRSFTLPQDVDINNIQAKMENGVLQVKLPKNEILPTKKNIKYINIQ